MNTNDPRYSRINRKKIRNRSNQLLNIMIGLVVALILIVGASIIIGNNESDEKETTSEQEELQETGSSDDEAQTEEDVSEPSGDSNATDDSGDDGDSSNQSTVTDGSDSNDGEAAENEEPGTVTIVPDDDGIIVESIIDTAWKPIGTDQTGVHESIYDENHVDWDEKKKALSYATGHPVEGLIFWRIGNAGGPQKSYGIVSTRDKSEMYRVYLEWVDEKGWKPVKMDILNTLDFDY